MSHLNVHVEEFTCPIPGLGIDMVWNVPPRDCRQLYLQRSGGPEADRG
jgi:hypothetical protein